MLSKTVLPSPSAARFVCTVSGPSPGSWEGGTKGDVSPCDYAQQKLYVIRETHEELRPATQSCPPPIDPSHRVSEIHNNEQAEEGPAEEGHAPTMHATQPTLPDSVPSAHFALAPLAGRERGHRKREVQTLAPLSTTDTCIVASRSLPSGSARIWVPP